MPCPYCLTDCCTETATFAADRVARISSLEASIAALSNPGKAKRERQNVGEFLLNLGVPFADTDIISVPDGEDPPDVLFDPARFEVKELYDDGRRRWDEYRKLLLDAQQATQCAELRPLTHYTPIDTSPAEILELAIGIGAKYSQGPT
jgi:hypothetical protein